MARVPLARILVVDDEEAIARGIARLLERAGYETMTAFDAAAALGLLAADPVDLVLSDMTMPGSSGLWLAEHVIREHPGTAVVMVSGVDDPTVASSALDLGAYGYVIKPFEHNEVLINVANALRRRSLEIENAQHRANLELLVAERTAALQDAHEETVRRLAAAAESRDSCTGGHLLRLGRYCELIAAGAGCSVEHIAQLGLASVLHDVGKIAIPDSILNKPGALTGPEMEVMRTHAELGYRMLAGSRSELLQMGATVALHHHERWDGTGYPNRVAGTDIPLEGRITALADVLDALLSARPYKPAFPLERALQMVTDGRGAHFDPALVDVLLAAPEAVAAIALEGQAEEVAAAG